MDYLCDPLEEKFEHPESLKLCEAVISKYYVDGTIINSIDANTLKILLGPIYYS